MGQPKTYSTCGTPDYFAPEMVRNARAKTTKEKLVFLGYGKPVDLWCLGVLLHELLTGASPFEG